VGSTSSKCPSAEHRPLSLAPEKKRTRRAGFHFCLLIVFNLPAVKSAFRGLESAQSAADRSARPCVDSRLARADHRERGPAALVDAITPRPISSLFCNELATMRKLRRTLSNLVAFHFGGD